VTQTKQLSEPRTPVYAEGANRSSIHTTDSLHSVLIK